jgi:hypothetical protein
MSIWEKIKLLFKINSAIKNIKEAKMKSGFLTSEFWLTLLGQAVPIVLALWGFIPQNVMLIIMGYAGVLSAIYIIARTWIKKTSSKKDDAIFNKINAILKPIADKLGIKLEDIEISE